MCLHSCKATETNTGTHTHAHRKKERLIWFHLFIPQPQLHRRGVNKTETNPMIQSPILGIKPSMAMWVLGARRVRVVGGRERLKSVQIHTTYSMVTSFGGSVRIVYCSLVDYCWHICLMLTCSKVWWQLVRALDVSLLIKWRGHEDCKCFTILLHWRRKWIHYNLKEMTITSQLEEKIEMKLGHWNKNKTNCREQAIANTCT